MSAVALSSSRIGLGIKVVVSSCIRVWKKLSASACWGGTASEARRAARRLARASFLLRRDISSELVCRADELDSSSEAGIAVVCGRWDFGHFIIFKKLT